VAEKSVDAAILIIIVVVIAAAAAMGGYYFGTRGRGAGVGGWWNTDWGYRRQITINNSGSLLENYQISVNVDYDGHMKTDFSDLRFVDGTAQLSYWIENYDQGKSAHVWIKIPSISGNGTKTLWMYYSNPSATSVSNVDNTFIFFDNFDTLNTRKWTTTSLASVSNSVLQLQPNGIYGAYVITSAMYGPNVAIRSRVNFVNEGGWYEEQQVGVCDGPGEYTTGDNVISAIIHWQYGQNLRTISASKETLTPSLIQWPGEWRVFELTWLPSEVDLKVNDSLSATSTTNISTAKLNAKIVYQQYGTGIMKVDWYLIREYTSPEPSVSVGLEERR
jgi:hypothetical protein